MRSERVLGRPAELTWLPDAWRPAKNPSRRRFATLRDALECWATLPEHARWAAMVNLECGGKLGAGDLARLLDRVVNDGEIGAERTGA